MSDNIDFYLIFNEDTKRKRDTFALPRNDYAEVCLDAFPKKRATLTPETSKQVLKRNWIWGPLKWTTFREAELLIINEFRHNGCLSKTTFAKFKMEHPQTRTQTNKPHPRDKPPEPVVRARKKSKINSKIPKLTEINTKINTEINTKINKKI